MIAVNYASGYLIFENISKEKLEKSVALFKKHYNDTFSWATIAVLYNAKYEEGTDIKAGDHVIIR